MSIGSSRSTASGCELLQTVETARAERNAAARAIAEAKGRGEDAAAEIARQSELKRSQSEGEEALARVEAAIQEVMVALPNPPHPSAPVGDTEEDAELVRVHGSPPDFAFPPRDHLDLAGPAGPRPDRPGGGRRACRAAGSTTCSATSCGSSSRSCSGGWRSCTRAASSR